MCIVRTVSLALVLVGALVACGTEPVSITTRGVITDDDAAHPTDGSRYDEYRFKTHAGWRIEATMRSDEVDSFLQLRRPNIGDSEWLIDADDVSATDKTAVIQIEAPATDTYVLWVNTTGAHERGAYTLTISAQPPQ